MSSQHMSSSIMACRYNVRMAVVNLDRPPAWWHKQAKDHMTAPEARALAGSDGALGSQRTCL